MQNEDYPHEAAHAPFAHSLKRKRECAPWNEQPAMKRSRTGRADSIASAQGQSTGQAPRHQTDCFSRVVPEHKMRLLTQWARFYESSTHGATCAESVTPKSPSMSSSQISNHQPKSEHQMQQQLFHCAQELMRKAQQYHHDEVEYSDSHTPVAAPMPHTFHPTQVQTCSPSVSYVSSPLGEGESSHGSLSNTEPSLHFRVPHRSESTSPASLAPPSMDELLLRDLLLNLKSSHVLKKSFPVSVLAKETGLMSEHKKDWRYRDLKRSLFSSKMSPAHSQFINDVVPHSMLQKRLPHNVTLINFCKRIHLLVFHFILRDGKLPRFFKMANAKVFCDTLQAHDPQFLKAFNEDVAFLTHQFILNGVPIANALEEARKSGAEGQ
eukprot:CAMPEP_0117447502 /NCGR_PEP_ID=MMETSP0759-20121206/6910_1 /TAXON_ID=63605 /ORGANISM="Percolomonas cosmopolitus, Strain WS" /LENGTH=379 /DNA_ID=CAMNT_0005239843 /DNA_START=155 /DNA_END=1294 /DNA_ORIENTATION=-